MRQCKVCHNNRAYIKNKSVYFDERGVRWASYAICGYCVKPRRLQRKSVEFVLEEDIEPIPTHHTTRKCRGCHNLIDLARYYYCLTCIPESIRPSDAQDDWVLV